MPPPADEIREIVARETRAWDTQDADLLISCFHPAMVWPWPPTPRSHDPMTWVLVLGRFDAARWRHGWQELFDSHTLVHNRRELKRVVVSPQGDGGFAVVDIDTLWRHRRTGAEQRWKGRTCKIYTQVGTRWPEYRADGAAAASPAPGPERGEWKMIAQVGALAY